MSDFVTFLQFLCDEDEAIYELCKTSLLSELGFSKNGQFIIDIKKVANFARVIDCSAYAGQCQTRKNTYNELLKSAKNKKLISNLLGKSGINFDHRNDQDLIH